LHSVVPEMQPSLHWAGHVSGGGSLQVVVPGRQPYLHVEGHLVTGGFSCPGLYQSHRAAPTMMTTTASSITSLRILPLSIFMFRYIKLSVAARFVIRITLYGLLRDYSFDISQTPSSSAIPPESLQE
jgi:hypothetical protein